MRRDGAVDFDAWTRLVDFHLQNLPHLRDYGKAPFVLALPGQLGRPERTPQYRLLTFCPMPSA